MGRLGSFLCSPQRAHQTHRIFRKRCSSKRAVGSNLAYPEEGRTSKLGRMIGTDLRTERLAIACGDRSDRAMHPSQVAGGSTSNRWEKRQHARTFGLIQLSFGERRSECSSKRAVGDHPAPPNKERASSAGTSMLDMLADTRSRGASASASHGTHLRASRCDHLDSTLRRSSERHWA